MCSYSSEFEDKSSFSLKEAVWETFNTKLDQFNTMRNILKVCASNRGMFRSGGCYHTLPELDLRRVFPGVQFINTDLPDERWKIL